MDSDKLDNFNFEEEKSKSIDKVNKPPLDKKLISPLVVNNNKNNNDLIYSKEFNNLNRDTQNKKHKRNSDKSKMYAMLYERPLNIFLFLFYLSLINIIQVFFI